VKTAHARERAQLRPARPHDIARLVRLMPRGAGAPMHTRYLLAENANGEFLGGAYLTINPKARGVPAACFQLAAADEAHADEIASLLLAGCVAQARADRAEMLSHDGMVREGSPMDRFLRAHGFEEAHALTEYVMDVEAARDAIDSAYRHIARRGRIPPDGRVLALQDAPIEPVQSLIARHLGPVADLDWNVAGSRVLADVSTVVQLGPRVVGALVIRDLEGQAEAPYDVVDKEFRAGWVTVAMWRRSCLKGTEAGYRSIRFKTSERFKVFSNFARRMQSAVLAREFRYVMPLAS